MLYNRVFPVDQRRKTVSAPDQPALVTLFRSLKLEAQPRLLPFILHTIEAAPLTPEFGRALLGRGKPDLQPDMHGLPGFAPSWN